MDLTTLQHDVEDGVLIVTLNRPEQLNAFTVTMAEELEWTFGHVNDRDDIRAVIVTGAGRAFCAGMDLAASGNAFGLDENQAPTLADMADLSDPRLERVRDTGGRVTLAIHACRKPVIAAINGAAVGIGATMTLAMDARLIGDRGRMGFVFGKLGITPEAASSWFLPRIVGMDVALDLVYSADILDAESAHRIGLVRSVHGGDDLLSAAKALADRWTKGRSAVAVALTRQLMYRNAVLEHPVDAHRVDSLAMFYASIADGAEGVAAFREKRDAQFTARASTGMPPFYDDWVSGT
ncbi:crotonase/enoyl-CoA hydratase family protein [Mycolicibacterium sp. F2034L]|uniref:crotonase/enoyl-CoA hydratase family protein n=1 Tax=Mycolicibacterium sp. F2034L TaxID=2926422 RepID=UPI001FF183E3|nr:crotonase/enoyl-CoA hydratase family protein [Mycolicibacterium sp. F2034L]MCK0173743.1 crotonase/enoyl-CoA hydratase family protein [Mycolicibacterium sp. F2034L]